MVFSIFFLVLSQTVSQVAQATEYDTIDRTTSYIVTEDGANKDWDDVFGEIILFEGEVDPNDNETFVQTTIKEVHFTNEPLVYRIKYWLSNGEDYYFARIVHQCGEDVEVGQYNCTFSWDTVGYEAYPYGIKLSLDIDPEDPSASADFTVEMDVRIVLNGNEKEDTKSSNINLLWIIFAISNKPI